MDDMNINNLKSRIRDFTEAREWDQLMCMDALMPRVNGCAVVAHPPKNLSIILSAEVETELVDTLIYFIRLADKLDIVLHKAAQNKNEANMQKYPVDKVKVNMQKGCMYVLQ